MLQPLEARLDHLPEDGEIFLQAAANLLHMPQITAILNSIIYFIPNLAVALLIIVAGAYLGNFCASLVFEAVTKERGPVCLGDRASPPRTAFRRPCLNVTRSPAVVESK